MQAGVSQLKEPFTPPRGEDWEGVREGGVREGGVKPKRSKSEEAGTTEQSAKTRQPGSNGRVSGTLDVFLRKMLSCSFDTERNSKGLGQLLSPL